MTDQELIARIKDQDAEAWLILYQRYLPLVWRYAYSQTRHVHRAEDLTSEAFFLFVEHLEHFDPCGGTVYGWLRAVAHNRLVDEYRHSRQVRRHAKDYSEIQIHPQFTSTSTTHSELEQRRLQVLNVLHELHDDHRLILEWKYHDKISIQEIASRLGKTTTAVQSMLFRARVRFRERFEALAKTPDAPTYFVTSTSFPPDSGSPDS